MKTKEMCDEYDFSTSSRNPYSSRLKKSVTIRLESDTIEYFKNLAKESGIPYQTLINLFLTRCAKEGRKPEVVWE